MYHVPQLFHNTKRPHNNRCRSLTSRLLCFGETCLYIIVFPMCSYLIIRARPRLNTLSITQIRPEMNSTDPITTPKNVTVSFFVGHMTFFSSERTSRRKRRALVYKLCFKRSHPAHEDEWQARRDSNPQPTVLETAALPVGATGLYTPSSILSLDAGCVPGRTCSIFSSQFCRGHSSCFSLLCSCVSYTHCMPV